MINRYPFWKHVLIAVVLAIGAVFALPNVFGEDPAVQISAARGASVGGALMTRGRIDVTEFCGAATSVSTTVTSTWHKRAWTAPSGCWSMPTACRPVQTAG